MAIETRVVQCVERVQSCGKVAGIELGFYIASGLDAVFKSRTHHRAFAFEEIKLKHGLHEIMDLPADSGGGEVGVIFWSLPIILGHVPETVMETIEVAHRFNKPGDRRAGGEFVFGIECCLVERFGIACRVVESGVVERSPGKGHELDGLVVGDEPRTDRSDDNRGWASVLAVVAVEVDGVVELGDRGGELNNAGVIDTLVPDWKVDDADVVLACQVRVRGDGVDADDRFDPQSRELVVMGGGGGFVAGVEPWGQEEEVVDRACLGGVMGGVMGRVRTGLV